MQFVSGVGSLGASGGGVAFWAHVGGFLAGIALVHPFKRSDFVAARRVLPRRVARRDWG